MAEYWAIINHNHLLRIVRKKGWKTQSHDWINFWLENTAHRLSISNTAMLFGKTHKLAHLTRQTV